MDRADWQALAEERIIAAQALLVAKQWSSAYYLAGYGLEFGLKSCILVRVAAYPGIIFEKKEFSKDCWTHSIKSLVDLAGLKGIQKAEIATNPALGQNWSIVNQWNEESRYQWKTQFDAEALYNAIVDIANGVMPWIKSRWN